VWLLFVVGQAGSGSEVVGHVCVKVDGPHSWLEHVSIGSPPNLVGDVFVHHVLCAVLVGYCIVNVSQLNESRHTKIDDPLGTM
jgi:hypothetical protein